jgi:ribonuclease Y
MFNIDFLSIAIGIAGGLVLAVIIYLTKRNTSFKLISQSKTIADDIKKEAKKEADNARKTTILEAKDEWFKQKNIYEREIKERQSEESRRKIIMSDLVALTNVLRLLIKKNLP